VLLTGFVAHRALCTWHPHVGGSSVEQQIETLEWSSDANTNGVFPVEPVGHNVRGLWGLPVRQEILGRQHDLFGLKIRMGSDLVGLPNDCRPPELSQ